MLAEQGERPGNLYASWRQQGGVDEDEDAVGTATTATEDEDDDTLSEYSDSFEDAHYGPLSPAPPVAPVFAYQQQQQQQRQHVAVKCAAAPLVHPDHAVSKRAWAGLARLHLGGGDVVVQDAVDDTTTEGSAVLDSDDEAIPEDLAVDTRRHAMRSLAAHGHDGVLDGGRGCRSAGDLRHREDTFTVRSPRTLVDRRQPLDGVLQGPDGQPLSVRRVRSALLRIKDIIHQDEDGDGRDARPLTACSVGRQGRRKDYAEWLREKQAADERRRQQQQRALEDKLRREREAADRQCALELDQEVNFLKWRQKKAVEWTRARRAEEEARRRQEAEREEAEKSAEQKRLQAHLVFNQWKLNKERQLHERQAREAALQQQKQQAQEERRRQAERAYSAWRGRRRGSRERVYLNPAPWVDLVPPADAEEAAVKPRRRRKSRSRCKRCRTQRLLQSAERLSRPATCPRDGALRTSALCPVHEHKQRSGSAQRVQRGGAGDQGGGGGGGRGDDAVLQDAVKPSAPLKSCLRPAKANPIFFTACAGTNTQQQPRRVRTAT